VCVCVCVCGRLKRSLCRVGAGGGWHVVAVEWVATAGG